MRLAELMSNYRSIFGSIKTQRDAAKLHLRTSLFDKPLSVEEIIHSGALKGISSSTLRRAKAELGIIAKKDGPLNTDGERTWRWHMPPIEDAQDAQGIHT
jgi:hypothetical protein